MAVTLVSDVIVPEIFSPYVRKETEEKAAFYRSGIITPSPELTQFLAGGGITYNMPTWQDLANDAENVATEAVGVMLGGAAVEPAIISTYNEVAVRLTRTKQYAASQLSKFLSGSDPMAAIASFVGHYEARRLQAATLAVLAGVFADNDAAPAGDDTHTAGDLTFDASGAGFVAGVTNFTAENLFDALQTAGDSQGDFRVLAVHSAVYNRMKKNNLIDFKQDSVTGAPLETFQGLELVVDDGMPFTGNVYHSYIFAPGALQIGWGSVERESEVAWLSDAGAGLGGEVLFRRWMYSIHPMGHAYIGAASLGGPANTVLEAAASWSRRCPERKQVKLARLITREA